MDVLITGGSNTVGTAITDHLADDERYAITNLDPEPHPRPEALVADLRGDATDPDGVRAAIEGMDAVVHLALVPGTGGAANHELDWSEPLAANLRAHNVTFAAAAEAGLDSLVFASSNHAVGLYEVEQAPDCYYPDHDLLVDHTAPHRPDSPYGLTKSYGENLGALAASQHGLQFYGLRIGATRDRPYDHPWGDPQRALESSDIERGSEGWDDAVARMHGMWFSRRDLARLVDACLQDDTVAWDVFHGVNGSAYSWFDVEHSREVLGFEAMDTPDDYDGPPASVEEAAGD
jgi:nucleoside-diphosphate-sugar epimerase